MCSYWHISLQGIRRKKKIETHWNSQGWIETKIKLKQMLYRWQNQEKRQIHGNYIATLKLMKDIIN